MFSMGTSNDIQSLLLKSTEAYYESLKVEMFLASEPFKIFLKRHWALSGMNMVSGFPDHLFHMYLHARVSLHKC